MIDLSENGLIGILVDLFFILSIFVAIMDLVLYVKGRKSLLSSIVFFFISFFILTVGLLTDYFRFDSVAIYFSLFFLLTLFVGLRFKKSIIFFWFFVFFIFIGSFIAFISYTLKDPENILRLEISRVNGKNIEGYVDYNGIVKNINLRADMIGFESFQIVIKPYLNFIFGGRRFIITSFFSELFNENGEESKIRYYSLGDTIINRRKIWNDLEAKKVFLIGFQNVQRINISIYPKVGKYKLKWKDSLYLLRDD